jgi:hypothetical protein
MVGKKVYMTKYFILIVLCHFVVYSLRPRINALLGMGTQTNAKTKLQKYPYKHRLR